MSVQPIRTATSEPLRGHLTGNELFCLALEEFTAVKCFLSFGEFVGPLSHTLTAAVQFAPYRNAQTQKKSNQ